VKDRIHQRQSSVGKKLPTEATFSFPLERLACSLRPPPGLAAATLQLGPSNRRLSRRAQNQRPTLRGDFSAAFSGYNGNCTQGSAAASGAFAGRRPPTKEQPKKVEIRPVRATLVQHALSGDTISLTGQIQAKDPISLAFRIGGRLQERSVTVGDPVAPGQVVARIEPQDFQNTLRSAEADLASAQAVLANSKGTVGRQSELLSKGFTTQAQYDQAEAQMKTAQAQVESAQARLQNAKDNLAYTDLKSDVAGSVTAKGAEPGEIVAAGRMILQVAKQGDRYAVFNVPSQLIRQSPKDPEIKGSDLYSARS